MFSKSLLVCFILTVLVVSCSGEQKDQETLKVTKKVVDTTATSKIPEKELKKDMKVIDKNTEKKEGHEKIVAKYGEQWDFCNCVTKNDSINKALEKTLTDKQTDKLMARWEFVDTKCKEFLTAPNTTPEERSKHEWKVKQCLKNAK
jgi:hypothetical protein